MSRSNEPLNVVCTAHVGDTLEVSHGTPHLTSTIEVLAIRGATAYFVIRHAPGGLSRVTPPHPSLKTVGDKINRRQPPAAQRKGFSWEIEE